MIGLSNQSCQNLLKITFAGLLTLMLFSCSASSANYDLHTWRRADSIEVVAEKYNTTVSQIRRLNNIYSQADLTPGTVLKIPVPSISTKPPRSMGASLSKPKGNNNLGLELPDQIISAPNSKMLIWPVNGKVISQFGMRHGRLHQGIDIPATKSTSILAAYSGVVTKAGRVNGYGLTIEIKHSSQLTTLYAHASKILVKEGDQVSQGQEIALVGRTGRATGNHLHFEVRLNGVAVDPEQFLPRLDSQVVVK